MESIDLGRALDLIDCSDLLWEYLCQTHGEVKTIAVSSYRKNFSTEKYYTHPSFKEGDEVKAKIWVANKLSKMAKATLDAIVKTQ